jgi:hypothetical protein
MATLTNLEKRHLQDVLDGSKLAADGDPYEEE